MQQKKLSKSSSKFTSVTEIVPKNISWHFLRMVNCLEKRAVGIMMVLLSYASTKTSPKNKIYWEHCTFIIPIILALASRLYDGGAS